MKYTVVWKPSAEAELARLWADATDRAALSAAADSVDGLLARDPEVRGESRQGSARIIVVQPLVVAFDVREDDRLVSVLSVWRMPASPKS